MTLLHCASKKMESKLVSVLRKSLVTEVSRRWIILQSLTASELPRLLKQAVPDAEIATQNPNGPSVETSDGMLMENGLYHAQAVFIDALSCPSHHDLAQAIHTAFLVLAQNRCCYVFTHTHKGADTHRKMLASSFGGVEVIGRGCGGFRVLQARRHDTYPTEAPMVSHYSFRAEFGGREFTFFTRPGLFSRERLDVGTRALLECVELPKGSEVLDLGCGAGPIGIILAKLHPTCSFVLIDQDPLAVEYARRNAKENKVANRVETLVSDGLAAIDGRTFDMVISHFPLHAGNDVLRRLFTEVSHALRIGGKMTGVALTAYRVDKILREIFPAVRVIKQTVATTHADAYTIYEVR